MSKSTQQSSKESKTKKDKSTKSKDAKAAAEEAEIESTKATVSVFLPELNAKKEEYNEIWKDKDESFNPQQFYYTDMIKHEQMMDMENELRKVVDEMMKGELLLLQVSRICDFLIIKKHKFQEAMDKDRGHKTKRKSSKKSRKGGKKSKKKKEKDLTPDRSTESLFEELVANGIIKK